jgi:hypothetical protein
MNATKTNVKYRLDLLARRFGSGRNASQQQWRVQQWQLLSPLPSCWYITSFACRSFAVYAVGEGWTGALTQQHLGKIIPGHFDDEGEVEATMGRTTMDNDTSTNCLQRQLPVVIYPYNDIKQVAVGWGLTALLDVEGSVKLVGRPHDVMSLLRLKRMPTWLRNWILARQQERDVDAVTPVGRAISSLIGWATGKEDKSDSSSFDSWQLAKKYSFLPDWTHLDQNTGDGNKRSSSSGKIHQIACGPGFMAMIEREGGTLLTMGVNNRGQCGVGTISNNVWTPQPVRGLTMNKTSRKNGIDTSRTFATEQDEPIIQVALGFQHGYALSKGGQVYSWGKAQRGQLGRKVDFDHDSWAGPILMDEKVIQVAAGHHHGALLTDHGTVFVWGKNMSRITANNKKPHDALQPEPVAGLPSTPKVIQISCGSHHTAMLLQNGSVYAIGIASDEAVPILNAVELIPHGILELPLQQFEAHFDRTTIIDKSGAVLQAHLWLDDTLRDYAYFTPSYVESLMLLPGNDDMQIRSIHRGWRHTVIVTGS